jgi:hypothetical protein
MTIFLYKECIFSFLACKYLKFYMDLRMMGDKRPKSQGKISSQFFASFFNEYHEIFKKQTVIDLKKKNEEKKLTMADYEGLFIFSLENLENFYRKYKRTISFQTMRTKLEECDIINERMIEFGVLSKF